MVLPLVGPSVAPFSIALAKVHVDGIGPQHVGPVIESFAVALLAEADDGRPLPCCLRFSPIPLTAMAFSLRDLIPSVPVFAFKRLRAVRFLVPPFAPEERVVTVVAYPVVGRP